MTTALVGVKRGGCHENEHRLCWFGPATTADQPEKVLQRWQSPLRPSRTLRRRPCALQFAHARREGALHQVQLLDVTELRLGPAPVWVQALMLLKHLLFDFCEELADGRHSQRAAGAGDGRRSVWVRCIEEAFAQSRRR